MDFALPTGTEIIAPHSGVIKEALMDADGYGLYIKIESETEGSVLGHLEKIDVSEGFVVEEGQHLGYSDNTGASTGPHLHWGYYKVPRDRSNGYNGFIDQGPVPVIPEVPVNTAPASPIALEQTKYQTGDLLKPLVDIPVGAKRGEASFDYGRVSVSAPAYITDIVWEASGKAFYDIDQTHIGGGTGWVDAARMDEVDMWSEPVEPPTPVIEPQPTPPEPDPVVDPCVELNAQLDQLRKERDEALTNYNNESVIVSELTSKLSAFKAINFETADEVVKILNSKDELILDCQKQLITAKDDNARLAKIVETNATEESGALDAGIKAATELSQLKEGLVDIAKNEGVKPTPKALATLIQNLKGDWEKLFKIVSKLDINNLPPQVSQWDKLMDKLGLGGKHE